MNKHTFDWRYMIPIKEAKRIVEFHKEKVAKNLEGISSCTDETIKEVAKNRPLVEVKLIQKKWQKVVKEIKKL